MITIETNIAKIDKESWNKFVENHICGSFFQTANIYDCYVNAVGHNPICFIAMEEKEVVGVLLADVLSEHGIKKYFSTRSIIIGGPLVKDNNIDITKELLLYYNKNINKRIIYTQIRNQFDQLIVNDAFQNNDYKFESHLNFIINLDNEEAIWNRIGKGRKKQIKKAIKNKLNVDIYKGLDITDDLINNGYKVIQNVYYRAKLPLADISLIKNVARSGHLAIFVVTNEEHIFMGCRFAILYKQSIYGWYAGSYDEFYKYYPNDILIWETLCWGCKNGYATFDYGGAGDPNKYYGVRSFKSQMGGTLVNYGRYGCVHKKIMMIIGKLGYKLYRMIQ